jgi:hypothetical protein
VRVHTDGEAAEAAAAIDSRAFTFGRHVVFAQGEYHPETPGGLHLIAHELAHVVQQSGAGPSVQRQPSKPHSPWEDWVPGFKPEIPQSPITPPSTNDVLGACRDHPDWPTCSSVCKLPWAGCKEMPSKSVCPPGYHASNSSSFKDQCCKDDPMGESQATCCSPEVARANNGCSKKDTPDPSQPSLCPPPGRKAPNGECCQPPQQPGISGCETPAPPPAPILVNELVDVFTVLFRTDHPHPGEGLDTSLAEGGRAELDAAIARLNSELALGAELIGNASKEADVGYNLDLTDRRIAAVKSGMGDAAAKVHDPMPPLYVVEGCRGSFGAYSCGKRDADESKPPQERDRNVKILIFRIRELPRFDPSPWKPQTPGLPPGVLNWPKPGPF